jgi:hypothetical protein
LKQFLAKHGIPELKPPPPPPQYSPDLSPSDFFLLPKIKSMMKERRFEDMEDIERNVKKEMFALHANKFKKCFQQFYDQAKKSVASQGYYFLRILKEMFNFKCGFLKIYSVLELICLTLYMEKITILCSTNVFHKLSYPHNRPWGCIRLLNVKDPTLYRRLAHRWQQDCQIYALAALYSPEILFF